MTESLTFSACVDEIVAESGRVDKKPLISDYVNTTVRECQGIALFSNDLVEDQQIPTADPFTWPKPNQFMKIKAVKYGNGEWPDFAQPGKGQTDKDYYYYGSGSDVVFFGCGSTSSDTVNIAYYAYLPRLKYFAVGHRPATWDVESSSWTYYDLTADGLLDYTILANQQTAIDLVTHWLLYRHYDLCKEGGLAKIFKNVTDTVRSGMAFSLFSTLKNDLLHFEAHESLLRG